MKWPWSSRNRSAAQKNRIAILCAKDRTDFIAAQKGKIIGSQRVALPSDNAAALGELLKTFCVDLKIDQAMVTLLLSPGSYQVLMVESPPVPHQELAQALRWKVKDLVTGPVEESIVDGFALPDDAYGGRQNMVYAVTTSKSPLQQQTDHLADIGFEVDRILLPELVTSELIASELREGQAEIVLVIGREQSFLSVYANGSIYFSRKLTIKDADLNTIADTEASEAQHTIDNFILELQRSRDYFESQLGKGVVSRIIVLQTEADAQKLATLVNERMQLMVDIAGNTITADPESFSLAGAEPQLLASCAMTAA